MSYITTISGKHFDPVEPEEALIDIKDIAHSLSLVCRGNGHVKHFYSVAQHSIACAREAQARGYSDTVVLACLLHDASEAYLSDVTRPVKKDLTYYLEVEDRLQHLIWRHFIGRDITPEEDTQVFAIDDDMMSMEFHLNMAETINEDYKRLVRTIDCAYEDPAKVEAEFLELFQTLV
ncbi:MAG: phosphohydrolase [Lachnospiraceae bacterium]|nr:phosphohydrolase [Lachnospiraceae bacterium]